MNSTGNSKPVSTNQNGIHKDLDAIVRKHCAHEDRTPIPTFVEDSLDLITQKHRETARSLWLDSFCGTGMSTRLLASAHPDYLIVGVDQSTHRLAAEPQTEGDNFLLVRSDCESLWRLMARQKIKLAHHTLFYPNPWPKAAHLKRRVHGNASFQALLALSDQLELRTNWNIYASEFDYALTLSNWISQRQPITPSQVLTRFEAKYSRSGHTLWQIKAHRQS